jgi:hypothetical protein
LSINAKLAAVRSASPLLKRKKSEIGLKKMQGGLDGKGKLKRGQNVVS